MPVDRKALKAKMREQHEKRYEAVKAIVFPLPDLRGPEGNAFVLLGMAGKLMKREGVDDVTYNEFHTDATSGNYEHLLATIEKWFTVAVPETKWVPLPGSILDVPRTATIDGEEDDDDDDTDDPDNGKLCVECGEVHPLHTVKCSHHAEGGQATTADIDKVLAALKQYGVESIVFEDNSESKEGDA